MHLTGIIITYNEAKHIADCIESLRFADQIIVFDSFSSDDTVQISLNAGAQVRQRKFDDFAGQRNAALEVASESDWVLFVDADERVSPELAEEVRTVIHSPDYAGWRIPRFNYILGHLTRGAGWYPDYQTRLLRVGSAHYDPSVKVHEVVLLDGELGTMEEHFIHYNYDTIEHFYAKQRKYTAYEAEILFDQGIRPKLRNYILQPIRHFRWRFLTLKGYRDGLHGLRLSLLMSWYEYLKYLWLGRLWRDQKRGAMRP